MLQRGAMMQDSLLSGTTFSGVHVLPTPNHSRCRGPVGIMKSSFACPGVSFLSATSASEQHQHVCAHAAIDVYVSLFSYTQY